MSSWTERINNGKGIFNLKLAQAKYLPYLLILLIVAIVMMWVSDTFFAEDERAAPIPNNASAVNDTPAAETDLLSYQRTLEQTLTQNLAQIKGVGKVAVTVNLASGSQYVFAQNKSGETRTTEEKDEQGGTRIITETKTTEDIVTLKNGATPLIVQEIKPTIAGIMVVADGASDSAIKATLLKAVQTATGLPAHKIIVLPRGGN